MSSVGPLIYAELLSNIRQISVVAALETPCDSATKAELSADGKQFTLEHCGINTTLDLPGQIVATFPLQKPGLGAKELSWRLPVVGPAQRPDIEDHDNEGPWSAKILTEESEFSCRSCGTALITKGVIKSWRDLPSENWAEMMDFWHCHKPSDHDHHGSNGHAESSDAESADKLVTSKGYGAGTKFAAQDGIAFVDIATFLLSETDITSVMQTSDRTTKPSLGSKPESWRNRARTHPVNCNTCRRNVGYYDLQAEGIKIWKWALSETLESHHDNRFENKDCPPSISSIVSCLIAAIISSQACSRLIFTIDSSPSTTTSHSPPLDYPMTADITGSPSSSSPMSAYHFWVLFPSVRYSSTKLPKDSNEPKNLKSISTKAGISAMKIFYKPVSIEAANSLSDDPNIEEVSLPADALCSLGEALRQSTQMLPQSGRKFQGWDVGLLDRYEEGVYQ